MCSNSGAMGVRRVRSNTENEPPHGTAMALGRTSDLGRDSCVGSLDDVHGPLEHERPASSSLQGPWVLILGQPPRCDKRQWQTPGVLENTNSIASYRTGQDDVDETQA